MTVENAIELADAATANEELLFIEATQGPTYAMNSSDINAFFEE